MAEFKTNAQVNYGWGLSLNMTGKAPAIAKRIFETYEDALSFVNDANDAAIVGLQLSVMNDSEDGKKGIYFVETIGSSVGANDGKIVRQATLDELNNNSSDLSSTITNNIIGTPEGETINESYDTIYKIAEELAKLEGDNTKEGSIAYDIKATVDSLDSVKTGNGTFVDVTVTQADGVITEVSVAESDIASAKGLSNEITRAQGAENTIRSEFAVADTALKNVLLDNATEDYNTLGKLEKAIKTVDAKVVALDVEDSEVLGSYVAEVDQSNGKISTVKKSLVSSANENDMLVADTTNGGLTLSTVWDCGTFEYEQ